MYSEVYTYNALRSWIIMVTGHQNILQTKTLKCLRALDQIQLTGNFKMHEI